MSKPYNICVPLLIEFILLGLTRTELLVVILMYFSCDTSFYKKATDGASNNCFYNLGVSVSYTDTV